MTTNNLLLDANTKHQLSVIQVGQQSALKFLPYLKEAREEITKQLLKAESIITKKELNELNRIIEKKLIEIYSKYPKVLLKDNKELVKAEFKFQKSILNEAITAAPAITLPNIDKAIATILNTPISLGVKGGGFYYNEILKGFAKQEAKRVRSRITAGYFNSETVAQIAQAISGTKRNGYKDGLLNVTRANAYTIAKTGTTHTQVQAATSVFKDNSDIIDRYQILSTLDSKTSLKCRSLDGQVFKIGQGPLPAFHPGCRTAITSVLKDKYNIPSAKADRLSETGDVGANTTAYGWLKRQPLDIQNQALGKERALIFRNSGLSPEEFRKASVDQFYEPLTIAQMAVKDKRIADYIKSTSQS
jgi:SPP1 gp7 family putative phage head morphogenesis protein